MCLACSAHWSSVLHILKARLPEGAIKYSHTVTGFSQQEGGKSITVHVEQRQNSGLDTDRKKLSVEADLLVGADGCSSSILSQLSQGTAALRSVSSPARVCRGMQVPDECSPSQAKRPFELGRRPQISIPQSGCIESRMQMKGSSGWLHPFRFISEHSE